MALPGETLANGASPYCPDCLKLLKVKVCKSGAGYYIGTWCCCGPYTRESQEYFQDQRQAENALFFDPEGKGIWWTRRR